MVHPTGRDADQRCRARRGGFLPFGERNQSIPADGSADADATDIGHERGHGQPREGGTIGGDLLRQSDRHDCSLDRTPGIVSVSSRQCHGSQHSAVGKLAQRYQPLGESLHAVGEHGVAASHVVEELAHGHECGRVEAQGALLGWQVVIVLSRRQLRLHLAEDDARYFRVEQRCDFFTVA